MPTNTPNLNLEKPLGSEKYDIAKLNANMDKIDTKFGELQNLGGIISGATAKVTPVDADTLALSDSAATGALKKLSWLNIKATLKAYFDTLYATTANLNLKAPIANPTFTGVVGGVFPIGSIYLSVVDTNPSTYFGGTWVSFATGRTLVGVDTAQTEFATVEKVGGFKTHALSTDEIPPHTHSLPNISTSQNTFGDRALAFGSPDFGLISATGQSGGGLAHNNLQPYITVYMWKRTA